jgi:uncharacterized protein (DUF488 family)
MLHRQRLILSLLADAGGEATHLEVTKWAFLTRMETSSAGGSSFYQFVPYQYGPFSFGLFQEVAAMTRNGLIEETPGSRWRLTDAGRAEARRAESGPAASGRSIVKRFAGKPATELIDHVYERYPWFTINSKIRREAARPVAPPAVYTAGYEGLLIDGFLNGLLKHGLARLIDVRHNPIARRYGYHKSTLARLCGNLGIEYRHVPELGIPSEDRQGLTSGGMAERMRLFESYERTTLTTQTTVIAAVAKMVKEKASVLVCMEATPCECHRSRLAKPIATLTGLPIEHLQIVA